MEHTGARGDLEMTPPSAAARAVAHILHRDVAHVLGRRVFVVLAALTLVRQELRLRDVAARTGRVWRLSAQLRAHTQAPGNDVKLISDVKR
jgi:hypothetical protein